MAFLFEVLQNRVLAGRSVPREMQKIVNATNEVRTVLEDILGLRGRSAQFTPDTALLGALPELDSMAVVGVLNALEEQFGFVVEDDEIDGSAFQTFGSLVAFVEQKLRG